MTTKGSPAARWLLALSTRSKWVWTVAIVLTALCTYRTVATYRALRSDLEQLLPEQAPSVLAMKQARDRLPGTRHLGIVIDTRGHLKEGLSFVDDLASRLKAYPPSLVAAVKTNSDEERAFAATYAIQLMDLGDIQALRKAVEQERDQQVSLALDADFDDEPSPVTSPTEALWKSLELKYRSRFGLGGSNPHNRFISADSRYAVIVVQAASHDTSYESDKQLLDRVKSDVRALGFPQAYHHEMSLGYAADVASRVEEMAGLVADLGLSTIIVGFLVLGSLWLFFRSAHALWILGLPLFTGTVAAFGVVALPPLSIVSLNSNTAFLGSIVIGNGINSSIILLSRYRQERLLGRARDQALEVAVESTYRPTLAACLAAAAAYGSLVFTSFRGFNQFGWIGAAGMLTCWGSAYTLLPLLIRSFDPFFHLGAGEKGPGNGLGAAPSRPYSLVARLTAALLARPRLVMAVVLVGLFASAAGIYQRRGQWVEYDLSQLRRADSWENGERFWGKRLDQTIERYLTPVVILTRNGDAAAKVAARVEALKAQGKAGNLISSVRTKSSLIPANPEASIAEARAIKALLTPNLLSKLPEPSRKLLDTALSEQSFEPLTPERVPRTLLTGLLDKTGQVDRNVLVFPTIAGGTWDSQRIVSFSEDLRREASSIDPGASVFGTLPLSSDIAASMNRDAPRITAISLLVVLVVCMLAFRSLSLSAWAIASLFVGVTLTLGVYAWSGGKLNFSNFVALPITFGIAADYSINMLRRRITDGFADAREAVFASGGAVALCSLTTIIGFGSLLLANNRALFSFGVVAVAGEVACLITAVIVLPTALYLAQSTRCTAPRALPSDDELEEHLSI